MTLLKITKKLSLLLAIFFISIAAFSQLNPIKKFDFKELENKTLYLPTFKASEKFISKMKRKGKFDKITDANKKAELYNKNWEEAMAESSYDATDYEIRAFDQRALLKNKNKKAIVLSFYVDDYGNRTVSMIVTGPKKRIIARSLINGFDLSEKSEIRLMMNMLNDALTAATEIEESGEKKNMKALKNKGKERLIEFYDEIGDKTFLVPKSTHKKPKKAAERDADIKLALKQWKLSKYEITTEEEIEKRRLEGDPDSYYWRDIPLYSSTLTYHINAIISTEDDAVITVFLGKGRLKPATLSKTQSKITSKANKYKKQLGK